MKRLTASPELIQLGFRRKLLGLGLGCLAALLNLFRHLRPGPRIRMDKRVMIVEPFGMGDVISLEPLVRVLLQEGYEVHVCARQEWKPLLSNSVRWLPVSAPWTSYDSASKYRMKAYFSREFKMFFKRFRDAAAGGIGIDTRGDIRSVLLLHLGGCDRVLTLSSYLGSDFRMLAGVGDRVPFSLELRRWQINLQFLTRIDCRRKEEITSPSLIQLRAQRCPSTRQIGLVPIAPWKGRWWEPQKWKSVIRHLREENFKVSALCGPGQEASAREELGQDVPVTECGSVAAWAKELSGLSIVVAVDSGPMHLADALGVPVVALFGPGALPLWEPSGRHSTVLAHRDDPDFCVCHQVEANVEFGKELMARISCEEVLNAIRLIQRSVDSHGAVEPESGVSACDRTC